MWGPKQRFLCEILDLTQNLLLEQKEKKKEKRKKNTPHTGYRMLPYCQWAQIYLVHSLTKQFAFPSSPP
jgi:hypothetical protein